MEKILVPDLGGFSDVEIIEMFVSEGDTVEKETSLFSLESDKAVMDIPSPYEGVIKTLMVSAGDKVSQGDIIGEIEISGKSEEKKESDIYVLKSTGESVEEPGIERDEVASLCTQ